jgi:cell envelope opacity-associated protein A
VLTAQEALTLASEYKLKGNTAFTSKPPNHSAAIKSYRAALDILPPLPKKEAKDDKPKVALPPVVDGQGGIQEVTEEEASAIEAQSKMDQAPDEGKDQVTEREKVEDEARELMKACWGNLAACHVALVS